MQSFALEEDDYLVTTIQEKYKEVTGVDLPVSYDPSVCDSNILAVTMGIPTITFGPSGGGMHAANEYGHAYHVKNCAEIYRLTVAELLK
jgi:acetylornithine deacetylase/succinyl-diaminopimelate desuccinylase-like protein